MVFSLGMSVGVSGWFNGISERQKRLGEGLHDPLEMEVKEEGKTKQVFSYRGGDEDQGFGFGGSEV